MTIKAPKGLSYQSRQTWNRVMETYILAPDSLLVLEGALREWDTYLAADVGSSARVASYKNFISSIRLLGISAASDAAL